MEEKESVQEEYRNTEPVLTHFDAQGNAVMVDVSGKDVTLREATAEGVIRMSQQCFELVRSGGMKKGDVLGVARIAGILCHILNLTKASLDFELMPADRDARPGIRALCTVRCSGKTGVEMEALTGVSVALLTIYDMCKAVDRSMEMEQVRLVRKSGGKSGLFERVPHVIKSM